jgi:hypothetical protein
MSLSGRWRGGYAYGTGGQHHPMELLLTQRGASLSGAGQDDIGNFSVKGTGGEDGAVRWVKSYPTHAVDYDGQSNGEFIRGAWRLMTGSGTFCLWGDGSGPALAEAKPEAKPQALPRRRKVA